MLRRILLMVLAMPAMLPAAAADFTGYTGQELYARFCASCHGDSGQGDGPVAASLTVQVPDLTRLARREGGRLDAGRLAEIIDGRAVVVAHGTRYMPVWGYEFWVEGGADATAEAQVNTVVSRLIGYLRSLQR